MLEQYEQQSTSLETCTIASCNDTQASIFTYTNAATASNDADGLISKIDNIQITRKADDLSSALKAFNKP